MKTRRRKKKRGTRGKGIYLLPNLLTSASLFGGFYAIIASIQGRYEAAAVAIIISSIFDGLDGRVARLTQATSRFGIEYDSLSDLVAFGVAPGVLAFMWALEPFGRLGWLAAFMYVICGALRLARFNVQSDALGSNYFKGLPIPAAACLISSSVLFASSFSGRVESKPILIISMIYILSFFMVSSIDYFSFKKFDIKKQKPFNVLVSIILIFIVIAYKPKIMFFLIMFSYVASGPFVTLYRAYIKRHSLETPKGAGANHEKGQDIPIKSPSEMR